MFFEKKNSTNLFKHNKIQIQVNEAVKILIIMKSTTYSKIQFLKVYHKIFQSNTRLTNSYKAMVE